MTSDQERCESFHTLVDEIDEIVALAHSQFPEIKDRHRLIRENGLFLVKPLPPTPEDPSPFKSLGGSLPSDGSRDFEKYLKIYAMYAEDAQTNKAAEYYVNRGTEFAAYAQESNMVILRIDQAESLRARACTFIHELGHFDRALKEGRVGLPDQGSVEARITEEVSMWTFDYKLCLAIGGSAYRIAVHDMVRAIREWSLGKGQEPDWQGKGLALHHCFGKPSAEREQFRDGLFKAYCFFLGADMCMNSQDALRYKAQFLGPGLKGIYQRDEALIQKYQK